ncbi:MAG: purine-nucleoside phosphorylase [Planctomycetes bacterium]|nr:purine-nucleoside phosphorylase [Planctomycetota bacterium]
MESIVEAAGKAAEAVSSKGSISPVIGIILGTGLGALGQTIDIDCTIPYADVPGFARPTVASHAGQLILGKIRDVPVIVMEGRFHCYEGYTAREVTFPVRLFKAMGADTLIVSNACGGMNPLYSKGDLMVIEDHINLMGVNPLIGPNEDALGPRFPDMCAPYDPDLIKLAEETALSMGMKLQRGVYVAVLGPNLETRAEYRMLRTMGADVVGMSTVPEVIVAAHTGLRSLGLSVVTDLCLPDALKPASLDEIIKTANEAEPKLAKLVEEVIAKLK